LSAAVVFVAVAVALVPGGLFGLASFASLFGVEVEVEAEAAAGPRSASGTGLEWEGATGHGAIAAGPGVGAVGADQEIEREDLSVAVAPEYSTVLSNCPAPDTVVRTPSGVAIVGPVALVEGEVVPGAVAAVGMRHKRDGGPG
jgi:hypothetical protein